MKLCTIVVNGRPELAARVNEKVTPLSCINEQMKTAFPLQMIDLIKAGESEVEKLNTLLKGKQFKPGYALNEVEFAPPFTTPPKILGIGLNFKKHTDDLQAGRPSEPTFFFKPATSIIGDKDHILLPAQSRRVTAEAELGVIIGKKCRDISETEADEVIFGYTTVIDVTAEDLFQQNLRFLARAKSFDTFFSFGPWIVTKDEIADINSINISTTLNKEYKIEAKVSDMFFSPRFLISFHSKVMTLEPGDIIATGTPGAVVIKEGDRVEASVEEVGYLVNYVKQRD